MVDIFTKGCALYQINMQFDVLNGIMNDVYTSNDFFIPFTFFDGQRGAVRKGDIIAYQEDVDNEET